MPRQELSEDSIEAFTIALNLPRTFAEENFYIDKNNTFLSPLMMYQLWKFTLRRFDIS